MEGHREAQGELTHRQNQREHIIQRAGKHGRWKGQGYATHSAQRRAGRAGTRERSQRYRRAQTKPYQCCRRPTRRLVDKPFSLFLLFQVSLPLISYLSRLELILTSLQSPSISVQYSCDLHSAACACARRQRRRT
eukprot:4462806-Pleurochrysis_carterae.AAC.5